MLLTLAELIELSKLARANGTELVFLDVALQWAESANAELDKLRQICAACTKTNPDTAPAAAVHVPKFRPGDRVRIGDRGSDYEVILSHIVYDVGLSGHFLGTFPEDSLQPVDELEKQIEREAELVHAAPTREERVAAADRLKQLHAMRSPDRVAEMEREAGIR